MHSGSDELIPDIRRLWAVDQEAILSHLLSLDSETRRIRFAGTISDQGIEDYASGILRYDSVICGAFIDGKLRAIAELRGLMNGWPTSAEAAFSVEPAWQNRGIGDTLFDHILAIAQNRSVKTLYMICLRENERMKHLAVKHKAQLEYHPGEVEAHLDTHWPTPFSMVREIAGETRGLTSAMLNWSGAGLLGWCKIT